MADDQAPAEGAVEEPQAEETPAAPDNTVNISVAVSSAVNLWVRLGVRPVRESYTSGNHRVTAGSSDTMNNMWQF